MEIDMITTEKQVEALEALDKAQNILNDDDTDDDIKSCLGSLISDVYDMEVRE
jgi:hypothetical protein